MKNSQRRYLYFPSNVVISGRESTMEKARLLDTYTGRMWYLSSDPKAWVWKYMVEGPK